VLILLCLLAQEASAFKPEPINAQVYLRSGDKLEIADIRVRGTEKTSFELRTGRVRQVVNIYRVSRIVRKEGRRNYEVLLDSGEVLEGEIPPISFIGKAVVADETPTVVTGSISEKEPDTVRVEISDVMRVHFVGGFQLRACQEGHYEQYTPYPFCPVCGRELNLGPFQEDIPEGPEMPIPFYRLRLDPRNPGGRGGQ